MKKILLKYVFALEGEKQQYNITQIWIGFRKREANKKYMWERK